jgi:cupin 2 domain-containing protein
MPVTAPPTVNLLAPCPEARHTEVSELLLARPGIRLERIVSHGQATPGGEWYDQHMAEWVLLLSGRAGLLIEGEGAERVLAPGDAVYFPARCRHRVTWTAPGIDTVWLALWL